MTRLFNIFLLLTVAVLTLSCRKEERLRTDRTRGLVKELLAKLDSADVYAEKRESEIDALKRQLGEASNGKEYDLLYGIAELYANYVLDSALVYLDKAAHVARVAGRDSLRIATEIRRSTILSIGGFYYASSETLSSIPRASLSGRLLGLYFNAQATLYHELYSSSYEPAALRRRYRKFYNVYRDSLLVVLDTMSLNYLRNMERIEARAGNFEEARRYNHIRLSLISDPKSEAYATCLYDRFLIAYHYEKRLTGKAVDDLLESAIIEVENSNHDIASLLRVETLLNDIDEVEDAKKVSDYYYSSLRRFGSRKRLVDGSEQAITINEQNFILLEKKNNQLRNAIAVISLLVIALSASLIVINNSRMKITRLKDNLQRSGRISKRYVGVIFKLYSSYIKRLDTFRIKIHATLRRGQLEQALELTSPSKDLASEERRELFRNFDSAFVDIFPEYIEIVNSCLKPQSQIVPKRTEILNNELRMLALVKLGVDSNEEIADMLHCSVKTVYNLKAIFKARLAVSEDEFNSRIMGL